MDPIFFTFPVDHHPEWQSGNLNQTSSAKDQQIPTTNGRNSNSTLGNAHLCAHSAISYLPKEVIPYSFSGSIVNNISQISNLPPVSIESFLLQSNQNQANSIKDTTVLPDLAEINANVNPLSLKRKSMNPGDEADIELRTSRKVKSIKEKGRRESKKQEREEIEKETIELAKLAYQYYKVLSHDEQSSKPFSKEEFSKEKQEVEGVKKTHEALRDCREIFVRGMNILNQEKEKDAKIVELKNELEKERAGRRVLTKYIMEHKKDCLMEFLNNLP